MMGSEMEMETYPSNYKQVDGISVPFSTETKAGGNPRMQMTVDEYVFDEEMADELFEKPVKEGE